MAWRAILTAFSTASAPELNSADVLAWSPGREGVEPLAHGHVALVGSDHEAGVGEAADLLAHRLDHGRDGVADAGHRDP